MTRLPLALVALLAIGGLTACSMDDSRYKKNEYAMQSNPAAVYCVQQDGKLDTITENNQRVTYCTLPSGEKVEQWEYYLERHDQAKESQ